MGLNRLRSFTCCQQSCCKLASSATQPAKRKHRLGFIVSQSKIQDVKVMPHVCAVCCASERQHPELDSETKYYLRNRLIVVMSCCKLASSAMQLASASIVSVSS